MPGDYGWGLSLSGKVLTGGGLGMWLFDGVERTGTMPENDSVFLC